MEKVDEGSALYKVLGDIPSSQAILPSVFMLLAVSRGGLLWLLNLMFFIAVAVTSFKKQKYFPRPRQYRTIAKLKVRIFSYFALRNKSPAELASRAQQHQAPAHAAAGNVKRGDFSWQPNYGGGGEQNPAYERSSDDDAHSAKQK